jgi:hypothetical protein
MTFDIICSRKKNLIKYKTLLTYPFFIPGHFFNIEHSPYLFPMFSFKKHRSMHVCNHVTKITKISTLQFNKMVKLFEEEIHIISYSMPIRALEMCVTFPMHDI